jgi:hypothetical protein
MPAYQDQFIEAALEEFITIELNLEQEHGLGTAFYNAMHNTVQALLEFLRNDAKSTQIWNAARECNGFPCQCFLPN